MISRCFWGVFQKHQLAWQMGDPCRCKFGTRSYEATILDAEQGSDRYLIKFLGWGDLRIVHETELTSTLGNTARKNQIKKVWDSHLWKVGDQCEAKVLNDSSFHSAVIHKVNQDEIDPQAHVPFYKVKFDLFPGFYKIHHWHLRRKESCTDK